MGHALLLAFKKPSTAEIIIILMFDRSIRRGTERKVGGGGGGGGMCRCVYFMAQQVQLHKEILSFLN